MDALALLCTLHADGPATLRLLRQAGCTSLDRVEELGPERLSELLDVPPAVARRFLREARSLRERIGIGLLEREEGPLDLAAPRASDKGSDPPMPMAPSPAVQRAPEAASLGSKDEDLMRKVLSAWRERDEREVGPAELSAAGPEGTGGTAPALPVGLRPGSLDGLTEECCRRLGSAGIGGIEDLVAADALDLAQVTGLGFTLIQRLQFLARRSPRASSPEIAGHADKFSFADAPAGLGVRGAAVEQDFDLLPHPPPEERSRSSSGASSEGRTERESASGPFA